MGWEHKRISISPGKDFVEENKTLLPDQLDRIVLVDHVIEWHSCLGGDKTWLAASSSVNRLLTHHFLCSPSAAAAMISWRTWSWKWLSCDNIFRCNSVAFFPSVFSTSLPLLSTVSQVLHSRSGRPQSSTVYSTPLSEPQYISWMDEMIWSGTTGCLSCTSPTTNDFWLPFRSLRGSQLDLGYQVSWKGNLGFLSMGAVTIKFKVGWQQSRYGIRELRSLQVA